MLVNKGDYEAWKIRGESKYDTTLYIFLKTMMEIAVNAAEERVFILPIVSGIFPFESVGLFPSTLYKHKRAVLQALPLKSAAKLVNQEMSTRKCLPKLCAKESLFHKLLGMLGT